LKTDEIENVANGLAEETDVALPVVSAEVQPEMYVLISKR